MKNKQFIAYLFIPPHGFWHLNLGISIDFYSPNIEIHLPFGFIRIGWKILNDTECKIENTYLIGYDPK